MPKQHKFYCAECHESVKLEDVETHECTKGHVLPTKTGLDFVRVECRVSGKMMMATIAYDDEEDIDEIYTKLEHDTRWFLQQKKGKSGRA